ncbi:hypothetical protein RHMOL_Rhmol05G0168100 [Rhododendron molle]|uniref:Uncharacterized protein n=1 Tax=Rhododendron molle TaxID=49168 RepID=A0ACC0NR17_RHOML|nr:hypothetical protein RHMOL_Rhmol05G0168100 [Rhododendron molle]
MKESFLDMDAATCCFCFSNGKKKTTRSKGISGRADQTKNRRDWEKREEMLSDMSTFSVEEQERRLKAAVEKEEKAVKEAERVVKWVKQESLRMDVSTVDRVLREDQDH